eukprot:13598960-Alexandrium_andersonii.AAC.1
MTAHCRQHPGRHHRHHHRDHIDRTTTVVFGICLHLSMASCITIGLVICLAWRAAFVGTSSIPHTVESAMLFGDVLSPCWLKALSPEPMALAALGGSLSALRSWSLVRSCRCNWFWRRDD